MNASKVFSAGVQRAVLYVVAAGLGALLPLIDPKAGPIDWQLVIRSVVYAMIFAVVTRLGEAGFDAWRASTGAVSTSDVGAFTKPITYETHYTFGTVAHTDAVPASLANPPAGVPPGSGEHP